MTCLGLNYFSTSNRIGDAGNTFHTAMTDFSGLVSYAVLLAYDFSKIRTLVDVGGGRGQFLRTVLQANPQMTGIVFDEESVIEGAKESPQGRCLAPADARSLQAISSNPCRWEPTPTSCAE